ncbi:MAG: ParB/RepB/Spo0J family partition protein [Acidobacteriota bacterium]
MSKFDPRAAMRKTLSHEAKATKDRFAIADEVTQAKPQGLAHPRRPATDTVVPMLPSVGGSTASGLKVDADSGLEILQSSDDLAAAVVGKTYLVALLLIESDNRYNARFYYPNEDIDRAAITLTEAGQHVPATGYVRDGKIALIDGQMRAKGMLSAGIPRIRVELTQAPTSPREAYLASRRINEMRSTQTALDDAVRWEQLLQEGIYESAVQLAKDVGKNESYVSQIRKINAIPHDLVLKMKDSPITSSYKVACAIASIFNKEEARTHPDRARQVAAEVIDETIGRELTVKAVEALISAKWKGPATRARGLSSQFKYAGKQGSINIYPSKGELKLTIAGLSEDQLDELKARIESTLSGA